MRMPNNIFVKWEGGNDEPFLEASKTKSELAEKNETVTIGQYQLVRVSKLSLKPVETDAQNVK